MDGLFSKYKNYIYLHLIIFIWGFTAILGELISVSTYQLVITRLIIAAVSIFIWIIYRKINFKISTRHLGYYLVTGFIIAAHWYFFFESIEISTVSIGLIGLSSSTLFTAFIEPFFFKRKITFYEILLGLFIIFGIYLIFNFQPEYVKGLAYSLAAGFFGSLFTVINGKLARNNHDPSVISFYEFIGGIIPLFLLVLVNGDFNASFFNFGLNDSIYLLILGTICTALAFVGSVAVMKEITPFTLIVAVNLEPIYGIILAWIIFDEANKMSAGFYLGSAVILGSVFINAYLKAKKRF